MDWSKGLSASYYMTIVDIRTWNDTSRLEITDGSISRSGSGLRQSASIDCPSYEAGTEKYIRIYMDVRQAGASDHVALFTGMAISPKNEHNGTIKKMPLDCYSVLKGAEDYPLKVGWYAAAGTNGAELIKSLLEKTIPAPVRIVGTSPNLAQSIIAEADEFVITMVDKILDAIGWRIVIDGMGVVTICEPCKETAATFGRHYDVIENEVNVERDWFKCPNVFQATSGDLTAIARDESSTSQLSIAVRGREVWRKESDCHLNDGESIEEYALRRLKEEQEKAVVVNYCRRYVPGIEVSDLVLLDYPIINLQGSFRITSQSIELGHSARVTEEVTAYECN